MIGSGTHLTETEFVDLFDGTLPAVRSQHVESCDACAAQAAELVAGAGQAAQAEVPEPPPFFWTQFSARVSDAISREAARPGLTSFRWARGLSEAAPGRGRRASWLAAAAGLAVVVLSVVVLRNAGDGRAAAPQGPVLERAESDAMGHGPADDGADLESDEAWALVRALAEDMDEHQLDDQGLSAAAGAAEHMALHLSDAERIELARLIREQLRLAGAAESAS